MFWVVRGLAGVSGRKMRYVFDNDVGTLEVCLQRCIVVLDFFHAVRVGRDDARALCLMEDRIMGTVYFIAPVDVGGEKPVGLTRFENLDFVSGCMGTKHEILVDIVAIRDRATGMICRKGEEVKVLVWGDERGDGGEMRVGWEVGFDEGAKGAEGMRGLSVEPEGEFREDRRGYIGHLIGWVFLPKHGHRRGTRQRGKRPQREPWTQREH